MASITQQSVCVPLFSGKHFICSGECYDSSSLRQLLTRFPRGLLMNGLSFDQATLLVEAGGDACSLGSRALLSTNRQHFGSSLSSLVRRGSRTYSVDWLSTEDLLDDYYSILKRSKQGSSRRLEYVYRLHPSESDYRCLARNRSTGAPAGLITVSQESERARIDLLLRSQDARSGLMEYLCFEVFTFLRRQGVTKLSMGEVPFLSEPKVLSKNWWSSAQVRQVFSMASNYYRINAGWYSAGGLHAFKEKFSPEWEPVYWGFWPRFTISDFFEFCIRSQIIAASCYRKPLSHSILQPGLQ